VPRFLGSRFREVGLVRCGPGRFVAYFVSPGGLVQQKLVEVDFDLTPDELTTVQNYLNERLKDRTLEVVRELVRQELTQAEALRDSLKCQALEICRQALPDTALRVTMEGATHLLEHPEFADVEKLRSVMRALDDKAAVLRLLDRVLDAHGVRVLLASEHQLRDVPELACVGTGVSMPSGQSGAIGLVGPARMDYGRLVPMVRYAVELFESYWHPHS